MSDDIYPDVDADATGGDALVRLLSEWDDEHFIKAVALVGAARREWAVSRAHDEKDAYHDDFAAFVTEATDQWDDATAQGGENE